MARSNKKSEPTGQKWLLYGRGKGKQKKKVSLHISTSNNKCENPSKNTELFGMKMIIDQFGDKYINASMIYLVGKGLKHYLETDGTNKSQRLI